MPEGTVERIRARLAVLAPLELAVEDDSAQHAGHEGARSGGGHYRLRMVSERFSGLPRMARHRLVYDALHDLMQRDIHALSMTLLAPDE
jgi:BolA protein